MHMPAVSFLPRFLFPWWIAATFISEGSCTNPPASGDSGVLTNLRFSPSAFDSFRRNAELRFTLSSPQTITVFITRDDSGGGREIVKTLILNSRETKGSHSTTWLGDNNKGTFAPAGSYLGVVTIEQESFSTSVQVFHF